MKEYEALFIIDPDKEKSLNEVIGGITDTIAKGNGKISKEENQGRQRLAYPIKKKRDAIYYRLNFSIEPSRIDGLNSSYRLNSDILRVMITKV